MFISLAGRIPGTGPAGNRRVAFERQLADGFVHRLDAFLYLLAFLAEVALQLDGQLEEGAWVLP
jgi:hypothetical protein